MAAWHELFPADREPTMDDVAAHIANPLWDAFTAFVDETYGAQPRIEYSRCGGAPGWNVKYKKSGRALCTLYPDAGAFTALISVGVKEAPEAELLLPTCSNYIRELFARTQTFNGARWLMIRVSEAQVLEDVKKLIRLRVVPKE